MTTVGDILKRERGDGPAKVRVVGADGKGDWIVADADEFAPPFTLTPDELRAAYGGSGRPELPEEVAAWARLLPEHESNIRRAVAEREANPPRSPEEVFAAEAAADGEV